MHMYGMGMYGHQDNGGLLGGLVDGLSSGIHLAQERKRLQMQQEQAQLQREAAGMEMAYKLATNYELPAGMRQDAYKGLRILAKRVHGMELPETVDFDSPLDAQLARIMGVPGGEPPVPANAPQSPQDRPQAIPVPTGNPPTQPADRRTWANLVSQECL